VILYVLGGAGAGHERNPSLRDFPLLNREANEAETAHLVRVLRLLESAMAAGGTHLLVPREIAEWLHDHPLVADFLAEHHDLVEANADSGVVFALRTQPPVTFSVEVEGWQVVPGEGIALAAEERLIAPRVTLRPTSLVHGLYRGLFVLSADALRTLRIRFILTRSDRRLPVRREIFISLARIGFLFHDLPFVEATFMPDGTVRLECDLKLDRGRWLDRVELEVVEEDNWRLHPNFPGGESFALLDAAPAGARLTLHELALEPTSSVRQGPPHGKVYGPRPAPYRKPAGRPRDAVIFSSWVPEGGLLLGDYFIDTLRRWHPDSKIFVGVNHGSSPRWSERLLASGLDVTIQPAAPTLTMPFDPTGLAAALDAYRRHDEVFDLVWFGHNKGGEHLNEAWYGTGRWMIERMYWSRRAEIERHFENPVIGLYTPHYLMLLQEHLTQIDALQRMYEATCSPLGTMAVSAHFVMRDESVRDFCAKVDPRFFRYGPEPFGGDRYWFEMAMPNVPTMQGYEPFIGPGLGGTSGPPKRNGVESILNDWRHNNAVVAIELEKWRQDPTHFRTKHCEHNRVD
jgi:hypothetical protein